MSVRSIGKATQREVQGQGPTHKKVGVGEVLAMAWPMPMPMAWTMGMMGPKDRARGRVGGGGGVHASFSKKTGRNREFWELLVHFIGPHFSV